jgi:hypothetical protein
LDWLAALTFPDTSNYQPPCYFLDFLYFLYDSFLFFYSIANAYSKRDIIEYLVATNSIQREKVFSFVKQLSDF